MHVSTLAQRQVHPSSPALLTKDIPLGLVYALVIYKAQTYLCTVNYLNFEHR